LTEDWIRTHTSGVNDVEPRLWFSDGSESEHSSLSGSENDWQEEQDKNRTPKADSVLDEAARRITRRNRGTSSTETLKPSPRTRRIVNMATAETTAVREALVGEKPQDGPTEKDVHRPGTPAQEGNGEVKLPATPTRTMEKPLPKEPAATPRIRKKIPWNGKNIMILLPRDEERGQPGKAPRPLRHDEIEKMFASWRELGYRTDGFDLLVEGYQPPGTDDSQSRGDWPQVEDVIRERSQKQYHVQLPDLNGRFLLLTAGDYSRTQFANG
jgi:hypothetical protein